MKTENALILAVLSSSLGCSVSSTQPPAPTVAAPRASTNHSLQPWVGRHLTEIEHAISSSCSRSMSKEERAAEVALTVTADGVAALTMKVKGRSRIAGSGPRPSAEEVVVPSVTCRWAGKAEPLKDAVQVRWQWRGATLGKGERPKEIPAACRVGETPSADSQDWAWTCRRDQRSTGRHRAVGVSMCAVVGDAPWLVAVALDHTRSLPLSRDAFVVVRLTENAMLDDLAARSVWIRRR